MSVCTGSACVPDPAITDGSGAPGLFGENWWNERHAYDWETHTSSGLTAHYFHMASANTYALGCATKRCEGPAPLGQPDGVWWYTICQYGPRGRAYWVDDKPYDLGPGGLVEPPNKVFDEHSGLCRP